MDILLSRILKYLNGTLLYDTNYHICNFIISHYQEMVDLDEEAFLKESGFSRDDLYGFISLLGYNQYDEFNNALYNNHVTRLNQIRVRLLDISSDDLIENMDKDCSNEEMKAQVSSICEKIFKAKRVILIGALYPTSIAVELQTDLITFGKQCIQYHNYDPMVLNKDDVVLFISATGRALRGFKRAKSDMHIEEAQTILITQNKQLTKTEVNDHTDVLYVPGKFDSINFNYQIMTICDLLRIHYFQQYYL